MSRDVEAGEVMEALRECLIALQLAETREERDLIHSQIHKLKQHISSSPSQHNPNKASA